MSAEETARKNVHVTFTREDADALVDGEITPTVLERVGVAIGEAGRRERAIAAARKLDEEGKLAPPIGPEEKPINPDDFLRVVFRQPDGEELRCSTFVPLDGANPHLRDALAASHPRFTVYTYDEAQRMVQQAPVERDREESGNE